MIRPIFLNVICLAILSLGSCPTTAESLPLPEHWATYYVIFLVANPDYARATPDQESVLTSAHIQYQLQLQESGQALAAGGLGQGTGESISGLTILRVNSLAEAEAIANRDPTVQAGRFKSWVREWWVPAGRLP
jgi:uncharacterized protein YciI